MAEPTALAKMRTRTFTGRLRTTPNPDFAGRDFGLTWLAVWGGYSASRSWPPSVARFRRGPRENSAHKRSPPDSGLVQKSDGEHSPIGARQIEFAASLPLMENHGLIR